MVLSRTDLTEYPRNAAEDVLSIRTLKFLEQTNGSTSSGQKDIVLLRELDNDLVKKKIVIKDPTDFSKSEIKIISAINGTTVTVDTNFANAYPDASCFYKLEGEKDIFDSAISDRVEANVQIIEQGDFVGGD